LLCDRSFHTASTHCGPSDSHTHWFCMVIRVSISEDHTFRENLQMDDRLPRKLAAILYADVAGYSRLTGLDEDATHRTLSEYLDLVAQTIKSNRGRVMHYAGDAVLAMFDAVVDAVSGATAIQEQLGIRNDDLPDHRKVQFRIGVNLGDVIEDRGDIYGDGVNIAARLEALAEPAGICISDAVRTAVGNKLPFEYLFIGEQQVKNIIEPVRAFRVFEQGTSASMQSAAQGSSTLPAIGKPSIAIKPFANIGADPEQEYFADGLTWDIHTALLKIPGLFLIEGESMSPDPKQMTVQELGLKLGVRYVLKGGVRRSGERVRVNAELIEVSTGRKLWGERYDRELHDLFTIQDEITEEIGTSLEVKLVAGEEARYTRNEIKNSTARDKLYRGEQVMYGSTKQEGREAQHLFEEVIRLEPASSLGYSMAAMAYWWEVYRGLSDDPSQALERAVELAREALRLEDTSGFPHLILAHTHLRKGEFDEALAEATQGVTARPSCNGAYALKANILIYLGRPAEAIDLAEYAVRLMPVNPPMYPAILASAYHGCDRHEEAISAALASIELDKSNIDPNLVLAASSAALGRSDKAHRATKEVLKLKPEFNLKEFVETQPYKEQEDLDRLAAQLSSAGLA
jgi:adenylate cyclase